MYPSNNNHQPIVRFLRKLSLCILAAGLFPVFTGQTFAQIRGSDSQEFFDEGDRQLNQDIQNLETPPAKSPTLQQEEQDLDQDLDIQEKDPNAPQEEEVPSPALGDGDNVPTPPPLGETEIKLPVP